MGQPIKLPPGGTIDVDWLARRVFSGAVTPTNLPKDVYFYNAGKLKEGVFQGYGTKLSKLQYLSPDYKLLNHLRENVFMFSAAKTFQQTVTMTDALTNKGAVRTFDEFKEEVTKINSEFNDTWLRTEYDTAIAQSQAASAWQRIEEQKSVLSMVKYVATEDENTCEICAPLDGMTAEVDDPVWDSVAPTNHFNCRCYLESYESDEVKATPDDERMETIETVTGRMDQTFKSNPGKTGEVFTRDHPYFDVPKKFQHFAEMNFGLPIPEEDTVPIPARVMSAVQLTQKAQEVAPMVDGIARGIASRNGATTTPINLKSIESIMRKANSDYGGDVSQVKDAVRTTIIAPKEKIPGIIEELRKQSITQRVKIQEAAKDELGYSGAIVNLIMKNGVQGEIQVNTAEMIYAKEPPASAKQILGNDRWSAINKTTGQEGGQGHKYYEQWRVIDKRNPDTAPERELIEAKSKEYYSHFR